MKFLRIGKEGQEIPVALDKDGKYRNLSSVIKDLNPESINFETLDKIKDINLESLEEISQNERIGSCISKPGNFFAIGLNYVEHAKETGAKTPENPVLFNKSVHSIVGPNDNVIIPKTSKKLDHEVEIAFVIGKKAKRVLEKDAQDYIFGYCICNDISEREWQKEKGGQWVKGKSGDTFGPLGPYLVTKDQIKDVNNLNLLFLSGNAVVIMVLLLTPKYDIFPSVFVAAVNAIVFKYTVLSVLYSTYILSDKSSIYTFSVV